MGMKSLGAALALSTCLMAGAHAATLNIAVDSSPAGLDPHLITAFNSVIVVGDTVYEGLTQIDEDLAVQPALAESWTVSDDGLTYTFTLREGVTFHDGSAMTAEDVAASLRRVLNEEVGSPLASRISPITDIVVVDDTTITLLLGAPFAPILTSLAGIAIVPAEMETDIEALQQVPVGTGPFQFSEWQPNNFISLTAFDGYREADMPKLEEVRFNIVPEAATRQVGLTSGQYHMIPGVDPASALQLQAAPNVTVLETRDLSYTLIGMNAEREPFNQPEVRRAFNMLLNRDEIIQGALFGAGVPAGPLSPALVNWAVDPSEFECYVSDAAAARAMMEEAGVELPVQLTMNVLPRQDIRDIAQVVQQQAAAAGFEIELLNQEIGQFVQDWRNSNFDLFASANGGNPDPDGYFYRTFYGGGSTNVFQYDDADVNQLLDDGRSTVDEDARIAAYDTLQRKLACEGPVAHIAFGTLATAIHDDVDGFVINPNRRLTSLKSVTIAE